MDLRSILMGLVFVMLWSSAFATGRIIVDGAPPLAALAVRFVISGLLALGLARMLGQSWRLTRPQGVSVVLFGLCQNALYLGLYFVALQWIDAGVAVIMAAAMPLVVAVLAWALRGERLAPLALAGIVAGFGGVVLIMGARLSGGADPLGLALCGLGTLALAVATLSVRGASAGGGNLLSVVGFQMLVGAVALLAVSVALEWPWHLRPTPGWMAAFGWQILGPGLAATLLWFALVGRIGATRAATFHFLNPFFGVLIAAVLLGERIGAMDLVGVAVIAGGILAVQLARPT